MDAGVLRKTFLFKDFTDEEIKRFAAVADDEQHSADDVVFKEGDLGNQFYVIMHGSVVVMKQNSEGADQTLVTLGTGSCFGEMALVDDDHKRTATILTKEPTKLAVFSQPALVKLLSKDDRLAHHFYKALARGLSARLKSTTHDASFYKALATQRGH